VKKKFVVCIEADDSWNPNFLRGNIEEEIPGLRVKWITEMLTGDFEQLLLSEITNSGCVGTLDIYKG